MSTIRCKALHRGEGRGSVLVLGDSLSLWGSVDRQTGVIQRPEHPQHGESMSGRVLGIVSGRGSSSSSSVLAEMIRSDVGPAAIVLQHPDGVITIGAIVATHLYGRAVPVVVMTEAEFRQFARGSFASVVASATRAAVTVTNATSGTTDGVRER